MRDRTDKRFFDFMCYCDDEGKEECERVYNEVKASFKEEYENREERFKVEVTDEIMTHLIVMNLAGMENGMAFIQDIYTDMWSGIAVQYEYGYTKCERDCNDDSCGYPKCEYKTQDFWIECDYIHHGLARAYQLVKQFDKSLT